VRINPAVVRRGYVDGLFGQMHFRECAPARADDGPPLLCLHMSPYSSRIYQRFIEAAGLSRRVIAFDTPGFGCSDAPPEPPEIEDYAAAMVSGLDGLGLSGPVDVLGYHTGSLIGGALARLRPDRVRRAVLISTIVLTELERREFEALYAPRALTLDGSHLAAAWQAAVRWQLHDGATLEDLQDVFPESLLGRATAWWGHRAAFRHDVGEVLPHLSQPVLMLNPEDDLSTYTARAAGLLRNGRILDLEGWGHGFLSRHARETAALLESFLDAPEASPFEGLALPACAAWSTPG
jgi:pimeloyl-ACP methyl ester carboxylesterase